MKRIVYFLLIVATLSSCSGAMRNKSTLYDGGFFSKHKQPKFHEQYTLYEVLHTDTIASVARKTGISAAAIIKYNAIKKPYLLKPGEILKIPSLKPEDDDLIEAVDSLDNIKSSTQRHIQIAPRKNG